MLEYDAFPEVRNACFAFEVVDWLWLMILQQLTRFELARFEHLGLLNLDFCIAFVEICHVLA